MSIENLQEPVLSESMQVLQCLLPRQILSFQEKLQLDNRLKGYQGEQEFAKLLKDYNKENRLILYNLRLETNNTEFEIDCLLLQNELMHLFEIKYYEGDFLYDDGKWFILGNKREISDPLAQLQRSEILFKQLLQNLNINLAVRGYLVFLHPNFQLYQAPLGKNIIYPAQLKRFMKKFTRQTTPLQSWHQDIINRLHTMHIKHSRHTRLPDYYFDTLTKAVFCLNCSGILVCNGRDLLYCQKCSLTESLELAIIRMTKDFHLLFPKEQITTRNIFTWCGEIVSMKVIRRILQKHLKMNGNGKGLYFTLK